MDTDWLEFEEQMNLAGIDIGDRCRRNIYYLQLLDELGEKQEAGLISEETVRKAAMAIYEVLEKEE